MRKVLIIVPFVGIGTIFLLWWNYQPREAEAANTVTLAIETEAPEMVPAEKLPPLKPDCRLSLELFTKMQVGRNEARITLTNVGNAPATLVHPGDASDCGWRTPIVRWSFRSLDSNEGHPAPRWPIGRCGNFNVIRPDELFTLQPGESQVLRNMWNGFPRNIKPGKYRVVFYYKNDPELRWKSGSSSDPNSLAMKRVRESTPVDLVSNEQIIELFE